MNVSNRVVAERVEIVAGEQGEELQQHRALTPWPAREDFRVVERGPHGRRDLRAELREIIHGEPAVVLAVVLRHGVREIALVEGVARGVQPFDPIRVCALFVDHELDRPREIRLDEELAFARRTPLGQPDGGVLRPLSIARLVHGDPVRHERVHGEPLARVADRSMGHVAEPHRPVALEREDPCVRRRGHHRAMDAVGDRALRVERLDIRGLGPAAEAGNRDHLVALRQVDDHRRNAGELHLIAVQHAERDSGGDAGIDRVATGLQDRVTGFGGEVVTGGDHVACRGDHRLEGHGRTLPETTGRECLRDWTLTRS